MKEMAGFANPFLRVQNDTEADHDNKKDKLRKKLTIRSAHIPIDDNTQYRLVSVDVSCAH
jgi:hypothetical protein